MNYAFRGKIRGTGKVIEGYIEAPNASAAIDQLADDGIIGVYSVRPEEEIPPGTIVRGRELAQQQPPPPKPEEILATLVEKMTTLIAHVEALLSRPVSAATNTPVRERESNQSRRIASFPPNQDDTLKAIFQTNLDLRKGLQKLNAYTAERSAANSSIEQPLQNQDGSPQPVSHRGPFLHSQPAA